MPDAAVLREILREGFPRLPGILLALATAWAVADGVRGRIGRGAGAERGFPGATAGGIVLSVAACIVPLLAAWCEATTDGSCLFGLLPWSDAGAYYRTAHSLLETGALGDWGGRRPLNAALLAVRLAVSGGDLRTALLLQAALLGISLLALAKTVRRDLGRPAALALFALCLLFAFGYLHTFLSETLGLTLGALAVSLLWSASRRESLGLLGLGSAVLALGLHARAGAFLMLPALAAWGLVSWPGGRRARLSACAAVLLGVAAATAFNLGLAAIHGARPGNSHGNFYYTLYGLAGGKPGWLRIYDDHPEVREMPEAQANAFIREAALGRLREDPLRMLDGLSAGWGAFRDALPVESERLQAARPAPFGYVRLLAVAAVGLVLHLFRLLRNGRRRESSLAFFLAAGTVASVPVLWVDGGVRVFAAAVPALALLPALSLSGFRTPADPGRGGGKAVGPQSGERFVAALAVGLAMAAAVGPQACRRLVSPKPAAFSASSDPSTAVVRSDSPRVRVVPGATAFEAFSPDISRFHLLRGIKLAGLAGFPEVPPGGVILLARDRQPGPGLGRYLFASGPHEMVAGPARDLRLSGSFDIRHETLEVAGWRDAEAAR